MSIQIFALISRMTSVEDLPTKSFRTLTSSRIILATGVSRISTIFGIFLRSPSSRDAVIQRYQPQYLQKKAHFREIVIHSSQSGSHLDQILDKVKPSSYNSDPDDDDTIVVVGGGKSFKELVEFVRIRTSSANDNRSVFSMAAKLALEGRKVAIVFESTNIFLASTVPTPSFVRKGRFVWS